MPTEYVKDAKSQHLVLKNNEAQKKEATEQVVDTNKGGGFTWSALAGAVVGFAIDNSLSLIPHTNF